VRARREAVDREPVEPLIRAIFELIHARSAAQGHLAQGITGIPYFFRQFGYEYALELRGGPRVAFTAIPNLPRGVAELFHLRLPTPHELFRTPNAWWLATLPHHNVRA
jgi:hypothetical protein